ncbi:MAG: hypothetical protein WCV50_00245 [Patescibacteria group bacterium]|jgi:ABC-type uncharacterized transport system permease subunit
MKFKIYLKKIKKYLLKHLNLLLILIISIISIGIIYFINVNIYKIVIAPEEIPKNEIIAKKQKVNIDLFNEISLEISNKKAASTDALQNLRNPF